MLFSANSSCTRGCSAAYFWMKPVSVRRAEKRNVPRLRRPTSVGAPVPVRWAQQRLHRPEGSDDGAVATVTAMAPTIAPPSRRETARELAARSSAGGRAHLARAFAHAQRATDTERVAARGRTRRRVAMERGKAEAAQAEVAALRGALGAQQQRLDAATEEAEVAVYALELAEQRAQRRHDQEVTARTAAATATRGADIHRALALHFGFGGAADAVARVEELHRGAAAHAAQREAQAAEIRALRRTVALLRAEAAEASAAALVAVGASEVSLSSGSDLVDDEERSRADGAEAWSVSSNSSSSSSSSSSSGGGGGGGGRSSNSSSSPAVLPAGHRLRAATLADVPILRRLEQLVVDAERPFDSKPGTIRTSNVQYYDLESLIAGEGQSSQLLLLEDSASGAVRATGYVQVRRSQAHKTHREHGYLGFMWVDPALRGRGVNQLLIAALLKVAREQLRVTHFYLDVFSNNAPAVRAYEKAGFAPLLTNMVLTCTER